ncbi:LPP20 family lipoprotein [Marinomonas sp. A79]|uniref:LPP20 family lipoprotein n=1 Tax=Marinomonas vulgaris TaxID=2823372 RepID=A0ABS5H8L8_9GAMM|nr:LPP20 family lipoprotein [Marinomonas vulgaris]MBR7887718.1 LPP20 family lipoprotein [Marinomonas vulgaris]
MTHRTLLTPLYWLATAGVVLSLSGCLVLSASSEESAQAAPDWVAAPPKSSRYLYGVGSAPRIENLALAFTQAEQNGNVQIAQQLRTQVSQINTQNTQVRTDQGNEQVSKIETAYTQVATSAIELEQATNEQRYAGENYVYALQSIDRSRIVAKLTSAISDTDARIRQLANSLTTSLGQVPVTQDWQTYMSLLPHFAQRKAYQNELSLYSTAEVTAGKPTIDVQNIEQQLNRALSVYGFDVSNTDQADALASALSSFGLTPKSGSIFILNSQTRQHSETQSGRFYVFEEGTLSLTGPDGTRLASWTLSARGIAQNLSSAAEKASEQWANQAAETMFTWLTRLQ